MTMENMTYDSKEIRMAQHKRLRRYSVMEQMLEAANSYWDTEFTKMDGQKPKRAQLIHRSISVRCTEKVHHNAVFIAKLGFTMTSSSDNTESGGH